MTEFKSQSQEAVFDEWGSVVRAAREDEGKVAVIAPFRAALETIHVEAVECKLLRDSLRAQSREATQRLQKLLVEGQDTASRLRSFVRGVFGPRSAKLAGYGIKLPKLRRPPRKPGTGEELAG